MKLYCTDAMQKVLGQRYKPASAPADPLDSWCAHYIPLSSGCVLVTLTEVRFSVLLWGISKDQRANLDQRIVQGIREALASYGTPQDLIDRYIPADTVLEKCGAASGTPSSTMNTISNRARKMIQQGEEPQKIQDHLNTAFLVRLAGVAYDSPVLAMQKLLQEYVPPAPKPVQIGVPAMELEVSLDLGIYTVRRTLIVPADTNFHLLHCYLQKAFDWEFCHMHEFVLPARKGRKEMHLVPQTSLPFDVLDRNYKLRDCLREGDVFQYIYDFGDNWEHRIRVRRVIPDCTEDLPICTLYEGAPPPEDVGGVFGFQDFYQVIQNPKDPNYEEVQEWIGEDWPHLYDAETVTARMHSLPSSIGD